MKKIILLLLLTVLSYLFTGCSQKVTIKTLYPSLVEDSSVKKISIDNFKNDDILLASTIQSNMNAIEFNNQKYFTITNRNQSSLISEEQKLQDSGLVKLSQNKQFNFGEVNSILSGSINEKKYTKNIFLEKRVNYNKCLRYEKDKDNKTKCIIYQTYNRICSNNIYTIRAILSISKVENISLIYAKNFYKQKILKYCSDYNTLLPDKYSIYIMLSNEIAIEFLKDISPSYRYFEVVLIDEEDITYTSLQEKLLKDALKLIKLNSLENAESLLSELVISTKSQSSTALYNLGVVKEGLGKLKEAYVLYKKAANINLLQDLNNDIINVVKRIEKSLKDRERALIQINN